MSAPRWARRLLARLAPPGREEEFIGDLEEAHRLRVARRGRMVALGLTVLETLDVAATLLRDRIFANRISWLDLKLGGRMLAKHPGLTAMGGISIAFAIFTGAVAFELVSKALYPTIPLPDGDRIVAFRLWDTARGGSESRMLYDARIWQGELRTVRDITVLRERQRNLVTPDGIGEPVVVAEISGAGLDLAGVPPLLGRALRPEDERPGAPAVVVIGYDLWTARFGGDPEIVGSDVRLGNTPTTVVGVMPDGFGFPVAHSMWAPFREAGEVYQPREGPGVVVLGRLADGVSLADANAELAVLGDRMAAAHPATHQRLEPEVLPLHRAVLGLGTSVWTLLSAVGLASNVPLILFLMLVCGNVALLMFARAASREGELVVRSALGASRARIVAQLFAEALVLAAGAAVLGLVAARYGLRWALWIIQTEVMEGEPLPFWITAQISPSTILYAGLLAVVAALVSGAWPGLRVTRALGEALKRGSAGGGGGFRFGGVWSLVIVGQVVLMMLFPLVTVAVRHGGQVELDYDPPFRAGEYAVARIRAEESAATPTAAIREAGSAPSSESPAGGVGVDAWEVVGGSVVARLEERLEAEPGVVGVTVAERMPMTYHPWHEVEIDGPSADPPDERGHRVGSSRVALDFFEVLGAEIVAGRGFHSADLEEEAHAVIVDDAFVERVLGGRNAVGARIRYRANESHRDPAQDAGSWLRIVGVVEELGARSFYGIGGIYHPVRPEALAIAHIIAHVPGGAAEFVPNVRAIGAAVDPTLPLHEVQTLVEATRGPRDFYAFWTAILVTLSGVALLLSLAGIYAVMSYTVAQRTREIGLRVALGSGRARVVRDVFRRPLRQVALGVLTTFVLLAVLLIGTGEVGYFARIVGWLLAYCALMGVVCLSACAAPTARALRVEPSEALRDEG